MVPRLLFHPSRPPRTCPASYPRQVDRVCASCERKAKPSLCRLLEPEFDFNYGLDVSAEGIPSDRQTRTFLADASKRRDLWLLGFLVATLGNFCEVTAPNLTCNGTS